MHGREAVGVFEFGVGGLPVTFTADRYRDLGGGRAVLTPFTGECGDYRPIDGLLVPHEMNGYWHVDGERVPFVRFVVERLDYDAPAPF